MRAYEKSKELLQQPEEDMFQRNMHFFYIKNNSRWSLKSDFKACRRDSTLAFIDTTKYNNILKKSLFSILIDWRKIYQGKMQKYQKYKDAFF